MNRKSDADLRRAEITYATRALVRMKHKFAADREINDILPDSLAEFDAALAQGQLLQLQHSLADALGDGASDEAGS